MVYTGQPSRGCSTCRKRHIKCDEALPECGACTRVKQTCPGYKNYFDLAWRDQTTVAKKSVERGKAKRKAARERKEAVAKAKAKAARQQAAEARYIRSSSGASDSPGQVFTPENYRSQPSPMSSRSQSTSLAKQGFNTPLYQDPYDTLLRPIPQEQALCFFFNNYIFPIRDPLARRGFLEYLAPFYMSSTPGSPLNTSTMAVATCMMSSRMGKPPDAPFTRSFYTRAVSSLSQMILQQRDCTSDDFIIAVMLLQLYEATTGQLRKRTSTNQPHPHLDGALALIRHRGPENFTNSISRSILLYVRGQLVENSLRNAVSVPIDVQGWGNIVSENEQIPVFRLDGINLELANLQASALSAIRYQHPHRSNQLMELNREAIDIERQLFKWSQSIPAIWDPIRIYRHQGVAPGLQLYQDHCDTYQTLFLSTLWNRLRSSYIDVKNIMLLCLAELPPALTNLATQNACRESIQQIADDICAGVPFFLGDRIKPGRTGDGDVQYPWAPGRTPVKDHYQTGPTMGGWALLIPLGTLMEKDIPLREGQRKWIAGQMARTAKIYNIAGFPTGPPKG
ncbi:hypothetical protein BJ878DRAFT_546471 [Calycina marina]|uniref:Zn(2)-C6 fungal-type domain-containing protein n=1 Tax=Calycina marina TaxID=1763456 RepID=A0A9P7YUY7_9HELO|nr:hypothetical protein BJ878DRAFT_546471 [Calycina marina]